MVRLHLMFNNFNLRYESEAVTVYIATCALQVTNHSIFL